MELPTNALGEFGLIDWVRRRTATRGRTVLGIGDDCAILRLAAGSDLLVTTDMLMDGRHFHLGRDGAEAVGFKALGVNLSDIAAMAGVPVAAVVAVALPRAGTVAIAQGLHAGMQRMAERYGVDLVGGDTNAWDGPLVVSVTVLGEATGRGPVRRSGARPGDVVCVTGPLGGSVLGRHLRPEPRIAEALALHAAAPLHALIDISDGLASDLGHILEESGGLGAVLDADAIPIHPDGRTQAQHDGRALLDHALNDGEDFELAV
ncbi:MAG: thiamine-phosphate kinase, partial [Planctomycetaceae bacterium]